MARAPKHDWLRHPVGPAGVEVLEVVKVLQILPHSNRSGPKPPREFRPGTGPLYESVILLKNISTWLKHAERHRRFWGPESTVKRASNNA